MNNEKFWFIDKIGINILNITPSELKKIIPFKELKKHCKSCSPRKASNIAQLGGFKSRINAVVPNKEFFRILENYVNDLPGHKISEIEIAEDTIYDTQYDAGRAFVEYKKIGELKWSTKSTVYEGDFAQIEKNGKWYHQTLYLGKKNFNLRIYPRMSKVNNQPCLHKEFKLMGASNIKNKTSIESIKDLIDINSEKTYALLENKFTSHSEIDWLKLGKFLKRKTRKRKLSEEEKSHLVIHAKLYCRIKKIKTYQDLKERFSIRKQSIRLKKGRKSNCDKYILKRPYGYFKK